jgi:hypothetical protein
MLKSSGPILQLSGGIGLSVVGKSSSVLEIPFACTELWVDEDYEMIAVEVKGLVPKHTSEIIGICRAPNEDMCAIEGLASHAVLTGNLTENRIKGSDLNLPQAIWNGDAGKMYGVQASINKLVCDNGSSQMVSRPT